MFAQWRQACRALAALRSDPAIDAQRRPQRASADGRRARAGPAADPSGALGRTRGPAAAAGQRPALTRDGGLHPLPDQVPAHRQPGRRCSATRTPATRPAASRPASGQEQRHAAATAPAGRPGDRARAAGASARSSTSSSIRRLAGQPAGQLHRFGGIGGADDQQPGELDAEPGRGGRVQAAEGVEAGDQATGAWQAASEPSARLVAPPPVGASSSASAPRGQPPVPRARSRSAGRSAGRVAAASVRRGPRPAAGRAGAAHPGAREGVGRAVGESGWTIMAQPMIEQTFD